MLKNVLFATSVLVLTAPAGGAMAQGYYGHSGQHSRDHREHGALHDGVDEAHAEAHAEGFYSRREHKSYHRALRGVHGEFHDEHPNTRHDGYRLPQRRSGGYYGYQSYDGYPNPYYVSPYGYSRGPIVTFSYGRRW